MRQLQNYFPGAPLPDMLQDAVVGFEDNLGSVTFSLMYHTVYFGMGDVGTEIKDLHAGILVVFQYIGIYGGYNLDFAEHPFPCFFSSGPAHDLVYGDLVVDDKIFEFQIQILENEIGGSAHCG